MKQPQASPCDRGVKFRVPGREKIRTGVQFHFYALRLTTYVSRTPNFHTRLYSTAMGTNLALTGGLKAAFMSVQRLALTGPLIISGALKFMT